MPKYSIELSQFPYWRRGLHMYRAGLHEHVLQGCETTRRMRTKSSAGQCRSDPLRGGVALPCHVRMHAETTLTGTASCDISRPAEPHGFQQHSSSCCCRAAAVHRCTLIWKQIMHPAVLCCHAPHMLPKAPPLPFTVLM